MGIVVDAIAGAATVAGCAWEAGVTLRRCGRRAQVVANDADGDGASSFATCGIHIQCCLQVFGVWAL